MNTSNTSTNLGGGNASANKQSRKFSLLINDSDSDDNILKEGVDEGETVDCFSWFNNKFANKDAGYRLSKLKMYREDSQMQSLAQSVFDFSMNDEDRFKLLFEMEGNLKLIWQFIYLSFFDQDLMMLELKYKQHAEDFQRINAFHQAAGFIAKKEAPKIYRLFKLFCLKDRVAIQRFYEQSKMPSTCISTRGLRLLHYASMPR